MGCSNFFHEIFEAKEVIFGRRSIHYASVAVSLGTSYYQTKQYDEAKEQFQRSIDIFSSTLGKASADKNSSGSLIQDKELKIASLHIKIGNVYAKQNKLDDAIESYQNAIKKKKNVLEENHVDILLIEHNIALIQIKTGDLDAAKEKLVEIQEKVKNAIGNDHIIVAKMDLDMCGIFVLKKEFRKANTLYGGAIQIFQKCNLPKTHMYSKQARNLKKSIEKGLEWKFFFPIVVKNVI